MRLRTAYKGNINFKSTTTSNYGFNFDLSSAPADVVVTAYDSISGTTTHHSGKLFIYNSFTDPEKVAIVIHAHNYKTIVTTASNYIKKPIVGSGLLRDEQPKATLSVKRNVAETTIGYQLNYSYSDATIIVSDINGNLVYEQDLPSNHESGDITLPSSLNGIYGVTLVVDGEKVGEKRVII